MDHIVWDDQTLMMISELLRQASESLEECLCELRVSYVYGAEMFQKNIGTSQLILRAMESAMQRTGLLSERTDALSGAMRKVRDMMASTEASIRKLAEPDDSGTSRPSLIDYIIPMPLPPGIHTVVFTSMSEQITGLVPPWLQEAADREMH